MWKLPSPLLGVLVRLLYPDPLTTGGIYSTGHPTGSPAHGGRGGDGRQGRVTDPKSNRPPDLTGDSSTQLAIDSAPSSRTL